MFIPGVGTVEEQWREIGVEIALGRMTAEEVYAAVGELFREFDTQIEQMQELRSLAYEWETKAGDLENDLRSAKDGLRELERGHENLLSKLRGIC